MTGKRKETDIRTRYEFLIAGIIVLVLCIVAFAVFRITDYLSGARDVPENTETKFDISDGTVLIEVEIRETTAPNETAEQTQETVTDGDPASALSEHDDIRIFTVTTVGENYYKSKAGRLDLYAEPKETNLDRPSLIEDAAFEVLGFSRDGWAAIEYGGQRYYVKSADIVQTDAPEGAAEKHKDPQDSQGIRFFVPNSGDIEYVATMSTKAFSLPDVMSSGNSIDLQRGERVIVVATGGNWFKIIYMNAEYYMLGYLQSRIDFIKDNPDSEIEDHTGYPEAGTPEAVMSATTAGAGDTANSSGVTLGGDPNDTTGQTNPSDQVHFSDPYEEANLTAPEGYQRELLTLTNAERKRVGVPPLVWDESLAYCAAIRAAELPQLSLEQNMNHLRPDGSEWFTVNEAIMYAENIAYGQKSVEEVFDDWLHSTTGHYEHMIDPDYRTFAVALYQTDIGYGYYWIEEFGY
ncbi:MAG: CAP domain-containing protein [Clostridiales bacterium]|nr:CAP domain-containing protein [Clostridiales bacterium]